MELEGEEGEGSICSESILVANCLTIPNAQCPIPNPQSPIPNPQFYI
ncbi:hypothetical protein Riv7116_0188 [Rivularia sp. PCC 7116]|nr:hypothetical protein Riv7116_0188 [Rivularia sp. PCC 7116]